MRYTKEWALLGLEHGAWTALVESGDLLPACLCYVPLHSNTAHPMACFWRPGVVFAIISTVSVHL